MNTADVALYRETREFAPTLDAAAERLGLSAMAIEKDYWVTEVLRTLCREFAGDFVFKGGTSLSKGYGLIERFSEDIDVLVLLGIRGRKAADNLMKKMGEVAAEGIGGHASPWGGSETGRHRGYEISYSATRPATALLRPSVVLELGTRGGDQPRESVSVGSLLRDVLVSAGTEITEFEDLQAFEVEVLHPGRTLLEKLALVHAEAQMLEAEGRRTPNPRIGRHFYDIHQLLGDIRAGELLNDRDEFKRVLREIDEVTTRHFALDTGDLVLRPDGGFAASLAFDPGSDVSTRLRTAYEATMPEFYYGRAPLPSWEAICDRVQASAALL